MLVMKKQNEILILLTTSFNNYSDIRSKMSEWYHSYMHGVNSVWETRLCHRFLHWTYRWIVTPIRIRNVGNVNWQLTRKLNMQWQFRFQNWIEHVQLPLSQQKHATFWSSQQKHATFWSFLKLQTGWDMVWLALHTRRHFPYGDMRNKVSEWYH